MPGWFSKESIVAQPGFNRWRVPPASVAIHLSIGSVYAWSIFNPALTKTQGVVVSAAGDWSLREVVWVFTVASVFLGPTPRRIEARANLEVHATSPLGAPGVGTAAPT